MRCAGYLVAAMLMGAAGPAAAQGADTGDASATRVNCKDGTSAQAGRGACAGHGGLGKIEGVPVTKVTPASIDTDENAKIAPATAPVASPAMVRCKDGMSMQLEPGACSRHGGIDKATSEAPRAIPGAAPSPRATFDGKAPNPKAELTDDGTNANTNTTIRCADGQMVQAKRYSETCAGHGGPPR
jgi:hypothetical protein